MLLFVNSSVLYPEASATEIPFIYDSGKIEPGTMYTYGLYTSSDEPNPHRRFYYYVRSQQGKELKLESLSTIVPENEDQDYQTFTLNMEYMMLQEETFQALSEKSEVALNTTWRAESKTDFNQKKNTLIYTNRREDGVESTTRINKFNGFPTFFYFTLHVDLWTAMRFYPYPQKRIDAWNYTGSKLTGIKIEYKGEEAIQVPAGETRCHKFEISGKGILALLFGKKAWVWMSAEDKKQYMVKYENKNPRGNWPMLKLQLVSIERISLEKWKEKIKKYEN